MNWKNYVEKQNAKAFVLPPGWDSRDAVAEQIGCSPDRVDDQLRPALKSGAVVKQQFRVWNDLLKRVQLVFAYRESAKNLTPKSSEADETTLAGTPAPGVSELVKRVKAMKAAGNTYAQIGAAIGRTGEAVRSLLKRAA